MYTQLLFYRLTIFVPTDSMAGHRLDPKVMLFSHSSVSQTTLPHYTADRGYNHPLPKGRKKQMKYIII